MDSDERARRAALAKRIRTGVIAAGAAGALGVTGLVAAEAAVAATNHGQTVDWTFAGDDGSSSDQGWQSDGGSWQVRPQSQGGTVTQPHAQTGGS